MQGKDEIQKLFFFTFIVPAGETLEYATLLSAKMCDVNSFERHFAQVKTYYYDYK